MNDPAAQYAGLRIAGVDEAGRGPWAGPVVAAAVVLGENAPEGITDSKKLRPAAREDLYRRITAGHLWSVGVASAEEIDTLNILRATMLAMRRAVEGLGITPDIALVDGNQPPSLPCKTECIVRGDSLCLSIAAASIVAKVTRDRLMTELCTLYPAYGFSRHMGYGTPQHQKALAEFGPCPQHRRSFAPVRIYSTKKARHPEVAG